MGTTLSDPNRGQIKIRFHLYRMRLIVPSTIPDKWRQRVDPRMWIHTAQLIQSCELTPDRDDKLKQISKVKIKIAPFTLILILAQVLFVLAFLEFNEFDTGRIALIASGGTLVIIGLIGLVIYNGKKSAIFSDYTKDVLTNLINLVDRLNTTYNGYIIFHQPVIRYRGNRGSDKRNKKHYIHIDVQMVADFVDYIDDTQVTPVVVPVINNANQIPIYQQNQIVISNTYVNNAGVSLPINQGPQRGYNYNYAEAQVMTTNVNANDLRQPLMNNNGGRADEGNVYTNV